MKLSKDGKQSILPFVCFIISVAILILGCFYSKSLIRPDTNGYINMITSRGPIYPLFLALMRVLFGEVNYLTVVPIFQAVLSAFAIYCFCRRICETLKVGVFAAVLSQLFGVLCLISPLILAIGNSTHYAPVLSEGLCIPFTIFTAEWLFYACAKKSRKTVILAAVFALLTALIRGQMIFLFVIVGIAAAYCFIKEEKPKAKRVTGAIFLGFAVCLMLVFSNSVLQKTYHLCVNGYYEGTTSGFKRILATRMIYLSDREDVEAISDETQKAIFLETFDYADDNELNVKYAEPGLLGNYYHFEASYDRILYGKLFDVATETYSVESSDSDEAKFIADQNFGEIGLSLYKAEPMRYLKLSVSCFVVSICRSMGILYKWMPTGVVVVIFILSALLLAIAGVLLSLFIKKEKDDKTAILIILALITVLGNCATISLSHYPLNRYTVYGFVIFYMSGVIALCKHIELCLAKKRNEMSKTESK